MLEVETQAGFRVFYFLRNKSQEMAFTIAGSLFERSRI